MIEVKDVYFTYPNGVEALKGVSLTIQNGEFVAIMGQNGAGKSIPYSEEVYVRFHTREGVVEGFFPIGDIIEESIRKCRSVNELDDTIIVYDNPLEVYAPTFDPKTHTIAWRRVTAFAKHRSPRKLIKVRTRTGREILTTGDHSFITLKDGKVIAIRGVELKKGDFIPIIRKLPHKALTERIMVSEVVGKSETLDGSMVRKAIQYYIENKRKVSMNEVIRKFHLPISRFTFSNYIHGYNKPPRIGKARYRKGACFKDIPSEFKLDDDFGYFIGVYLSEGHIDGNHVVITTDEPELRAKIIAFGSKIGAKPSVGEDGLDHIFSSKILSLFLSKMCGNSAREKTVPKFTFYAPMNFILGLLRGYFDGDGYVSKRGREIEVCSRSKRLIFEVSSLLTKIGIVSYIKESEDEYGKLWDLVITRKFFNIFDNYIGFNVRRKRERLKVAKCGDKCYEGIDVIPGSGRILRNLRRKVIIPKSERSFDECVAKASSRQVIGRDTLRVYVERLKGYRKKGDIGEELTILERLYKSDVLWDRVVEVDVIGSDDEFVYDFCIDGTETFAANLGNVITHNTTLVKHFNGLLKPTRGEVMVDGVSTREVSVASLARKVGFVFQNPDHQLFCETVEEEVAFALRNFGFKEDAIKRRVTWALNLLGLTQYRQTSPFMLSGGERKRVALASALAWNPKVVILDEPTIGQDYQQKEKLRHFIVQLNAQGKTVIIVTHDVEFVADCNPRVVLMAQGKMVADGGAKKILTNYDLVAEASIVPPQIAQIFLGLKDMGLPTDLIDVYEARRVLLKTLGDPL